MVPTAACGSALFRQPHPALSWFLVGACRPPGRHAGLACLGGGTAMATATRRARSNQETAVNVVRGPPARGDGKTVASPLTSEQVWRKVTKASFAVLSYVTPAGEPRSSGVVYKVVGRRLYVAVAPDSWKAKHVAASGRVAVTVMVRRGGVLSLVAPIPPATVSFHGAAIAVFRLSLRYRRDLKAARSRLAEVDRRVVPTDWGAVEYAERGSGEPLLVLHGIFHGCDGGLLTVRDLCPDRRVIAPSRFGYLGSSLPAHATPADQADALAALLDTLGIGEIDVIGISAGATSALQLALRHPEKVKHLVVLVGNLPGSPTAVVQPSWGRLLDRQLPMWALKVFSPPTMARLAGVPKSFPMTGDDARFVTEFIDSLFPVAPRARGAIFDAFVSNADVNDYNLEAIRVPTLIVHTKDDPLASHDAAKRAAGRIPGARLVSLESGGHLMLGQTEIICNELAGFLADRVGVGQVHEARVGFG